MKAIDIDVGGTFTDLVLTWDDQRVVAKAPTTPYDLSVGFAVQRTADILDEGYEIFMRSSRSSMGVAGDSIVAMFNAAGDLVNASAGTYLHAVIPPIVIKYILARHAENPGINDGDIWYTNDALYGGIHNPDQVAIMPVFFEGELVAWTAALSHTTETGAVEPGGMPLAARARFEEGMNLAPMRGTNFRINHDVLEMFADMIAYPINTEGQGARATSDGMDAYGFPWCAFGRAPDVESMENEFPMIIPFSSHWKDSGGAGKHRGGVGTAQLWVTHHVPYLFQMAIADNSRIQTPQPLFGGYAQPTVPGIVLDGINVGEALTSARAGTLTLEALLAGEFGGTVVAQPYGSAVHPVNGGEAIIVGLSTGGTGYGDPLDRDPGDVARDVTRNLVSAGVARSVYGVVLTERGQVDADATRAERAAQVATRLRRGRPYGEFEAGWNQRQPPEEILEFFGSWPDGAVVNPLIRM